MHLTLSFDLANSLGPILLKRTCFRLSFCRYSSTIILIVASIVLTSFVSAQPKQRTQNFMKEADLDIFQPFLQDISYGLKTHYWVSTEEKKCES